jgi:hypothetical protein
MQSCGRSRGHAENQRPAAEEMPALRQAAAAATMSAPVFRLKGGGCTRPTSRAIRTISATSPIVRRRAAAPATAPGPGEGRATRRRLTGTPRVGMQAPGDAPSKDKRTRRRTRRGPRRAEKKPRGAGRTGGEFGADTPGRGKTPAKDRSRPVHCRQNLPSVGQAGLPAPRPGLSIARFFLCGLGRTIIAGRSTV